MKRRLKSFEMFKESYLVEFEDEALPKDLEDETEPATDDIPSDEPSLEELPAGDEELPAEEGSEDEAPLEDEAVEVEDEEKITLKAKILSVIDSNYSENLTDLINGIIGELEETEDKDKVIDALLDVLEEKVEETLLGGGEEAIEGDDMPLDGEESEELPAEEGSEEEAPIDAPAEEGSEEGSEDAPVAPEMTDEE